jgi:hypothetical protein
MKNKTRYTEYNKVLNNKQWEDVYKGLTINKWQAGFMLGGIFIFLLGVAWFVGNCIAYFIEAIV